MSKILLYICTCVRMNVKFSSTRPTSRVNLLSLECELIFILMKMTQMEDKMSKI
jgi:hypothetical protein